MNETAPPPAPPPASTPRSDPAEGEWPARPWLSAAVLALAGLVAWSAVDGAESIEHWRYAIAAAAAFGALAWALIAQPRRLAEHTAFALGVGLVIGGIAWRVAAGEDGHADAGFWFAAGVLAAVIAVPLWQAGVLRDRLRTSYAAVHHHVWTDAICVAGALAFTGLAWALLALLAVLFDLVGIGLLSDLIDEGWFGWSFSGAAFGAGLGTLREQAKVLGTLRHVVQLVLAILAVPLALALVFCSSPRCWSPGRRCCGTRPTARRRCCSPARSVLSCSAMRCCATMMRSGRLRACCGSPRWCWCWRSSRWLCSPRSAPGRGSRSTACRPSGSGRWSRWSSATMYGLAYWVAAARGRLGPGSWRGGVRQANLRLAMLTCAPGAAAGAAACIDFGAVATRDQLARLNSGAVPVERVRFRRAALGFRRCRPRGAG